MSEHPIHELDDDVHQRVRLGILASLAVLARADFTHLKRELAVTDGNLGRPSLDAYAALFNVPRADTVQTVGARRVVLTHWDDFFRPSDRPLRSLPYAGDDLDVTLRVLRQAADEQGVQLHLPSVRQREDAWS